jgi:hypothetical protein
MTESKLARRRIFSQLLAKHGSDGKSDRRLGHGNLPKRGGDDERTVHAAESVQNAKSRVGGP